MPARRPPPFTRSTYAIAAALALAAAGGARRAMAQEVAGSVLRAGTTEPVPNAVVALVDSAGRRVVGLLSDSAGAFTLRAPYPGRWTVRAERVGSAPDAAGPFALAAGATARAVLRLTPRDEPAAATLGTVVARADRRCQVSPAAGSAAYALWEEVRKALDAAVTAADVHAVPWALERELRAYSDSAGQERLAFAQRLVLPPGLGDPFAAAPAEVLARRGFVWEDRAGPSPEQTEWVHNAPDARVLLDPAFYATHCFAPAAPNAERPGMVGLEFAPAPRGRFARRRPDVRGTLWLDAGTLALRELTFAHVNVPAPVRHGNAGGAMRFAQMPNGVWYLRDWVIRTAAGDLRYLQATDAGWRPWRREEGGRTLVGDSIPRAPAGRARVRGVLFDSTDLTPLGGFRLVGEARVRGAPPADSAADPAATLAADSAAWARAPRTADDGAFAAEFPVDSAGTRDILVQAPRLASLGIRTLRARVAVVPGYETVIPLGLPSPPTLLARLCGGGGGRGAGAARGTAVTGVVRAPRLADGGLGAPAAGVQVRVSWRPGPRAGEVTLSGSTLAETNEFGHYAVCGLPPGARIRVRPAAEPCAAARAEGETTRGPLLVIPDVIVPDAAACRVARG